MSKTILFAASSKINVLEDNTLITEKYTEYVESLLSAGHQTWQQVGDIDGGASNKDLTGTTPLLKLDFTAEGSIGIINTVLPNGVRNSNVSYGLMYYANREPDHQIIARFNNDDQYFESIYVSWDSNYVISNMRLRTRAYTYRYNILFVFDITANDFKHVYIQNQTNFGTYYNFVYGIKRYNRSNIEWRPTYVNDSGSFAALFNNTNLKEIITYDAELEFNKINTNLITYGKIVKKPPSYINIDSRIIDYKNTTPYTERDNNLYNFNFNFFVEGKTGDIPVFIKCLVDNDRSFQATLKNNHPYSITTLKSSYLITAQDNYYKLITPTNYKIMIPGEIIGTISMNKCKAPAGALYVMCYREDDNFLIGKYPVNNGSYEIPNLDCNSFYNIILVDSSRTFEWMVSSHRKPNPYNELVEEEYDVATINKIYIEYDMYGKRTLKWIINNTNIDYFNLYITDIELTDDVNLDFLPPPIKIRGLSYEILTTDNRAYYALEAVYKDKVSNRSQIHINTIVDNTKLMGVYSE